MRALLPEPFLQNPHSPAPQFSRSIERPDVAKWCRTIRARQRTAPASYPRLPAAFPDATVIATGGIVYHLALNDVLANFDDDQDSALLESLLLDETLARNGHTQYAVAIAQKL